MNYINFFITYNIDIDLLYRDVKEHMTLCQSEHLELSVRRVFEQQSVIVDLVRRVGELEGTSSSQRTHIVALEGGLVAATAALKVSEARQAAHLQEQINRIDANLQRRVTDVEGKFYKETTSLHKAVRDSFKK